MLGVPLFLSARNPTGPSVNFRWTSGVLSWLMSEMLGSKYCPGLGSSCEWPPAPRLRWTA